MFSPFVRHLAVLRECLDAAEIPYLYLDGSTPAIRHVRDLRPYSVETAGQQDFVRRYLAERSAP